jgi:hypothetical protein
VCYANDLNHSAHTTPTTTPKTRKNTFELKNKTYLFVSIVGVAFAPFLALANFVSSLTKNSKNKTAKSKN